MSDFDDLHRGPPSVFYENKSARYWLEDGGGTFRSYPHRAATVLLKRAGLVKTEENDEIGQCLNNAIVENSFDFPLAVAGLEKGLHEINGSLVLVPKELRLVDPQPGEWPTLKRIWENSLGTDQFRWLYWWLAGTLQGLHAGQWVPAPVAAFIGETGSCKSFTQSVLTEVFGGREARVIQGMTGATTFNGDWAEAVHLVVEDDFGENSKAIRQRIKETVKAVAVNEHHRIHPKGSQAIVIRPFWRMSVSCNPVEESLAVLPEIDETVSGKLALLWFRRAQMPMPTATPPDRKRLWETIQAELPGMVHEMLNAGAVPSDLQDPEGRCIVRAWHHQIALEELQKLSPDGSMLSQILKILEGSDWSGTAQDMLDLLRENEAAGQWSSKGLGRLLSRLCLSHRSKVREIFGDSHSKVKRYAIGGQHEIAA